MALEQYIQRIEDKLQLLVRKLQQVQGENALLREQIRLNEEELSAQNDAIATLSGKLQMTKIAANTQGAPSTKEDDDEFKKEMKSRINDYIREIDRCIAILNS
jgi:predicted  nucleic acid-binding Zn-ribbon protein